MSKRVRAVLALVVLVLHSAVRAGPADEAEAAIGRFFESFVAGNHESVSALFAADAQFYGTNSAELVTTPDAVRQYFVRSLTGPAIVKAVPLTVRSMVLSDSVVTVAGSWRLERTLEGKTTDFGPFRITAVLQKRGDRWVIVQFHNSPRPAPAPTAGR